MGKYIDMWYDDARTTAEGIIPQILGGETMKRNELTQEEVERRFAEINAQEPEPIRAL